MSAFNFWIFCKLLLSGDDLAWGGGGGWPSFSLTVVFSSFSLTSFLTVSSFSPLHWQSPKEYFNVSRCVYNIYTKMLKYALIFLILRKWQKNVFLIIIFLYLIVPLDTQSLILGSWFVAVNST